MIATQRVLIVDDSPYARRRIRDALAGVAKLQIVGEASDGAHALELTAQLEPDIISLDIEMPGLGGLEVLRSVTQSHPDVKVVLVSSYTKRGAEVTLDGLALGAVDFVTKTGSLDAGPGGFRAEIIRVFTAVAAGRSPATADPAGAEVIHGDPLRAPTAICVVSSTGGPSALTDFLSSLPGPPSAPLLIVQHMPPTFISRPVKRLDGCGPVQVVEAEEGLELRAGLAIMAKGDRHLTVHRGRVRLDDSPRIGGLRPRGDITLRSLARNYGAGAMGIVLTGMGEDGLAGCRAISAVGGQVLAQDAASSVIDTMPGSIRDAGLAQVTGRPGALAKATTRVGGISLEPRSSESTAAVSVSSATTLDLVPAVTALLRELDDFDLDGVKDPQLHRWINGFMERNQLTGGHALTSLRRDPALRKDLMRRLTINTTEFFRDPSYWEQIAVQVIPNLGATPRMWSVGCSDGSEPYSLAMLALEAELNPSVFATDIDEASLATAAAGAYPENRMAGVSVERRRRFFINRSGTWTIDRDVRSLVRFKYHNVLTDAKLPGLFDLIACRNLAIYFKREAQAVLNDRLVSALKGGGYLFIGGAERIVDAPGLQLERVGMFLFRRKRIGARR